MPIFLVHCWVATVAPKILLNLLFDACNCVCCRLSTLMMTRLLPSVRPGRASSQQCAAMQVQARRKLCRRIPMAVAASGSASRSNGRQTLRCPLLPIQQMWLLANDNIAGPLFHTVSYLYSISQTATLQVNVLSSGALTHALLAAWSHIRRCQMHMVVHDNPDLTAQQYRPRVTACCATLSGQ